MYVERFDDMPFSVAGAKLWEADAAPARESAEKRGVLNTVPPFEIVLEPTGKTTEAGRPVLRYARVRGGSVKPVATVAEAEAETPATEPSSGDQELERRRARLHALGRELYNGSWDEVRRRNVQRLTNGATDSVMDLDLEAIERLIAGLERLQQKQRMAATG